MKLFFKRNERPDFYELLQKQCLLTEESMQLFLEFIKSTDSALSEEIEAHEKNADKIRAELIENVKDSFITPLDRHDLFSVSRSIDDITDKIKDLKDFLLFFKISPTKSKTLMAQCILDAITYICRAVENMHGKSDDSFWETIVKAKKCENQVKRYYWENIYEIRDMELDINSIIVLREFSKDLNCLANKIGKTADRLGDIKVKSIQ